MSHAGNDVGDDAQDEPKPLLPRRTATVNQAFLAIGLVFLFGLLIGFVLARTL